MLVNVSQTQIKNNFSLETIKTPIFELSEEATIVLEALLEEPHPSGWVYPLLMVAITRFSLHTAFSAKADPYAPG